MMTKIIDFPAPQQKEEPDPEFLKFDDFGREMQMYALQYEMDGKTWGGVEFWAYSMDDAEKRVRAMQKTLKCLGQIYGGGVA